MNDVLISLMAKIEILKCLPQSEYKAVAEHLLKDIRIIIHDIESYKESLKKEWQQKEIEWILTRANKGTYTVYEDNEYRYISTITKEKI